MNRLLMKKFTVLRPSCPLLLLFLPVFFVWQRFVDE